MINLIYLYLGQSSLIWAASEGRTDVVQVLLQHGADINAMDNDG